ncbi:MAG: xanthine dehydrogenase family protein molybdopterin-binding subunit [Burkholderiales bacterium]|nr:xanthine dehydrogenase family protein molybdopterin-binding subunit [Burkholderiales bacterium]
MKRRSLLVAGGLLGGGLLIGGFGTRRPSDLSRVGSPADFPAPEGAVALNAWLHIGLDGRVTVASPRAEMGQGTHTGLAVLVAEELDADWAQVRVANAPMQPVYANAAMFLNLLPLEGEGGLARWARGATLRFGVSLGWQVTGGSASIRDAWGPLRLAGAMARALLLQAAAHRLQRPLAELRTEAGAVWAGPQRLLGFGELAGAAALLEAPAEVTLKSRKDWRLIGRSPPRLDLPAKVNGTAQFGIDTRLPGMLYASVRRSPTFGGRCSGLAVEAIRQRQGVHSAFVLHDQLAVVVAERWWQAESALREHPPVFVPGPRGSLNSQDMRATLRRALDQHEGFAFEDRGDAKAQVAKAVGAVKAEYEAPFLAHAPLEPQNCAAQVAAGQVTIWMPTQAASLVRWKIARLLKLDSEAVTVHTTWLGGGFGRRLETDLAEQAVAIAQRLDGRPVQLLWSREEDFTQGVYRPMGVSRFEAVLAEDGKPLAWRNQLAGPSIGYEQTGRIAEWAAMDAPDKNHLEGAFHLPYAIPHFEARQLRIPLGVPVGSWRSVGHSLNGFFTECFLDELAQAAQQDPLAYRDALLDAQPRHRAVLREVAMRAGWGQPLPPGRARGVALHESFGSICAQVVEASVHEGQPRVHRVWAVLDAGTVVHPDAVKAQVEGSIVFALSAALHGEITIENGAVQQRNFPQQPLIGMADMPIIEVALMDSEAEPGGVGEPGVPPLAPALANALSSLLGRRIRRLPIRL